MQFQKREINPGDKFNRWTVVEELENDGKRQFLCECTCTNRRVIPLGNLVSGKSKSCGCYRRELEIERSGKPSPRTENWDEYRIWGGIKTRCENERTAAYASYGARGVRMCEAWRSSFVQFLTDMGPRPSKLHSVDRIDHSGNYEPANCRWASRREQANNRRSNYNVEYNGETRSLAEWERVTGISWSTIKGRLGAGWSAEAALTTPVPENRKRAKAELTTLPAVAKVQDEREVA